MQKNDIVIKSYVGLDVSEKMIEIAKERTGQRIIACDVIYDALPSADIYFCSGAMNILTRFETFMFIRRCYEACKVGFVFNILEGDDDSLVYNHFYARELDELFESLGAHVRYKRGYLDHDISIYLKKSEQ